MASIIYGNLLISGSITSGFIGNTAILSGNIASGQIGSLHAASGTQIDLSRVVFSDAFATGEAISGFKAACLTSGGTLVNAMAGSGLRLPAMGVVPLNYTSGASTILISMGRVMAPIGLDATWSGAAGKSLYVGSGGMLITSSGFVSGQFTQRLGVALSGGIYVNVDNLIMSGGPVISVI